MIENWPVLTRRSFVLLSFRLCLINRDYCLYIVTFIIRQSLEKTKKSGVIMNMCNALQLLALHRDISFQINT